jgi:hypothetical protein
MKWTHPNAQIRKIACHPNDAETIVVNYQTDWLGENMGGHEKKPQKKEQSTFHPVQAV